MNTVLRIDKVFHNLCPPLSAEEFAQLEESLLTEGCRNPICIWNGAIIDGHNRYEICLRHNVPFRTQAFYRKTKVEIIAWICANQVEYKNMADATRRYLIGKRYEAEKAAANIYEKSSLPKSGQNCATSESEESSAKGGAAASIARWMGAEYTRSRFSVQRYGYYARAIDVISEKNEGLAARFLSEQTQMSQENVIELSRLSARELGYISERVIRDDLRFLGRGILRHGLKNPPRKPKPRRDAASDKASIKDMPVFDPDAEISSLTLTIPSWISSIERTQGMTNLGLVSDVAKTKITEMLCSLKNASDQLLGMIGE